MMTPICSRSVGTLGTTTMNSTADMIAAQIVVIAAKRFTIEFAFLSALTFLIKCDAKKVIKKKCDTAKHPI